MSNYRTFPLLVALIAVCLLPAIAAAQPYADPGPPQPQHTQKEKLDWSSQQGYTTLEHRYVDGGFQDFSGLTPSIDDLRMRLSDPQPTFSGRTDQNEIKRPDFTARLWTLFALNYFDRPPYDDSNDDVGYLVELGFEFGLPTFGRQGSGVVATIVGAVGWQGYHAPGPNPTTAHTSISFLGGWQYSFNGDDALQFGAFFRIDFAFDPLRFDDGSPAIGNDGIMGNMLGGFIRYVFRIDDFILPAGIFAGFDLNNGARELMVGVDIGGLIGVIIVAILVALDDVHFGHHTHIYID